MSQGTENQRLRLLFGRRKFTIALLGLLLSFVGLAFGWLDGSQWVTCLGLDVGLYAGAEMGETIAKAINGKGATT